MSLGTIEIRDLLEIEESAIRKYAIFTLSELLLRPVMYDPFSSRSHNRDLMHRRSTFGEKFRSAFKKGKPEAPNAMRPSSSASTMCALFGRPLEEVRLWECVCTNSLLQILLEDRMRSGNKRLKIPIVVAVTVEYLREHGLLRCSCA